MTRSRSFSRMNRAIQFANRVGGRVCIRAGEIKVFFRRSDSR
jgi:hypothetical protein